MLTHFDNESFDAQLLKLWPLLTPSLTLTADTETVPHEYVALTDFALALPHVTFTSPSNNLDMVLE